MRLGILGAGSIARVVVEAWRDSFLPGVEIVGIAARDPASVNAAALARTAGTQAVALRELLAGSPDVVLEAATGDAVKEHALEIVDSGAKLIVISSGGLIHKPLLQQVRERQLLGAEILLPSGGIAGLDGIAALGATGGLESVELTTTKPPASLAGAPYVLDNGLALNESEASVIFEGNVYEAVAGFPANINIAASVSLVGIGPDATVVRIVADPAASNFRHRVRASGRAGTLQVEVNSFPNPANPRSSYLAALSAVAMVQRVGHGRLTGRS